MKWKFNAKRKTSLLVMVLLSVLMISSYFAINASARFIDPEIPEPPPPSTTHSFVVYGYVKSSSGQALVGARVRLTYGSPETGIYKTVYTNSNGYYYASVTTSLYVYCSVNAYKSGYASKTISVYSKGTNRRDFSLSVAQHSVTVSGNVKDQITQAPIIGASVKLSSPSGSISKTVSTDSLGNYRVYVYTTDYTNYDLEVSKSGYTTEEIQVYSSGSHTRNFDLCIPTVQIDVFSPDFIPVSFGNNIKTTVQFFSGYSIVDISIKFNLGSGSVDLKDYPTGLTWTILDHSCEYVRADGTRYEMDQQDQDAILYYGNCFVHYDAAFDFGTGSVEINFRVRINSVVFRLEFNTIMRQYQNIHVFYEPIGLTGNAYVESYSDQVYDFMSQILNNVYNDFLSSLYGPEIPMFYDAVASILGTVFGFIEGEYQSHPILRLEFHGP